MNKRSFKVFSLITILALMLMVVPMQSAGAVSAGVVISQIYGGGGNSGATLKNDFIELFNRGNVPVDMTGWSVQYASTTGNSWQRTNISGILQPGQYYLIQQAQGAGGTVNLPTPDASGSIAMSSSAGKVALVNNQTTITTGISCPTGSSIIDFVGFGPVTNCSETAPTSPNLTNTTAALRLESGCTETDNNASDFAASTPTPRNKISPIYICPEAAPAVASTVPTNGAANVPLNSNITVTFSEPVNVTDPWFTLACEVSGPHTATVSGGPTTFTLNVDSDFVNSENCVLTIQADKVTDQDGNDPPDNLTVNFLTGFSTYEVCGDPAKLIHDIQGNGTSSPIVGSIVAIQGIVVGDFQGSGSLGGYYVQEEDIDTDVDPSTSEGIFVFNTAFPVSVGDEVRVRGAVTEFNGETEINNVSNSLQCSTSNPLPTTTDVSLPVTSLGDFERYEGMLVRFPQPLVIAEYFNYDRFGEIVLAKPLDGEARPFTGTAIDEPGAAANARTLANSLSRITLDDVNSSQNPSLLRHPNGLPFSLNNRFRGGDTVQNAVGVLGYDFSLYRIFPTGPAEYTATNPRTDAPEPVNGSLRVAAMNTLNFFVTADYPTGNPLDNKCGPANSVECRGWDSDQVDEFTRQRTKLLAALSGLDADVIGLNELENSTGIEPLENIVSGLPGYDYIDTGTIGTDAIKVGLIYRPAVVTPVGDYKLLTSAVDPRFIDTKSRPSLAQSFEVNATGARFTVVVNHLKSKGSDCNDIGDPDNGDGQGNCSQTREFAAQALVDWIATDPTGSGDADYIIMGDLNSYAQEDTIDVIKAGADDLAGTYDDYTNLINKYQGPYAYSYVFDGQAGYLDHALSFPSLTAQITGAADWHINADEPDVLDYDTSFKPAAQDALFEANAYRTSDHDPVVVGMDLLHYNFTGFLQPVDNSPVLNVAKAGNAIPVKFSLSGDQGLDIFLNGYPLAKPLACASSSGTDPIEQTVTAGGSSLSYDPLTDQYTYVWKTNKSWAGSCRQLVLILKDGSIHTANFQFK